MEEHVNILLKNQLLIKVEQHWILNNTACPSGAGSVSLRDERRRKRD